MSDIDIDEDIIESLVGFHAFTGNDYISSFFRKGKNSCNKILEAKSEFQRAFAQLGEDWDVSENIVKDLEHFLCLLYGCKAKDVDSARYEMFDKKFQNENKVIDMSLLIPCKQVFMLRLSRANYYAAILKRTLSLHMDAPPSTEHAWNEDGTPIWTSEIFPHDIEELFFDPDFDQTFA